VLGVGGEMQHDILDHGGLSRLEQGHARRPAVTVDLGCFAALTEIKRDARGEDTRSRTLVAPGEARIAQNS
jgi:hypothetical protein